MGIRFTTRCLLAMLALAVPVWAAYGQDFSALRVEQYFESLRQQAGIPGLSAAIVQDRQVVWERGFGFADVERSIPATPDTPYPIGGLTSVLSAIQALQCVEDGRLSLDHRAADLLPGFNESTSTLRDVLSHVTPARRFVYDPPRYDVVAAAIKACKGRTLRASLVESLFEQAGMMQSVPGHDFTIWSKATATQFPAAALDRYARVIGNMARPYRSNGRGKPTPTTFSPSTGLTGASGAVSSAHDLARLQSSLDRRALLSPETLLEAWTPMRLADGRVSPHGHGWFAQVYEGQLVVWQFGVIADAFSALQITLPQQGITLILLANSDGLVEPFPLANGDLSASPFARLFLRLFS
jgi:CubicO group peptidase (beta-lactamase class C family)